MKGRGWASRVLSVTLIGALVVGCGTAGAPSAMTKVKVLLPTGGPSVLYYPFFIGQELGYFRDEGIDITVEGGAGAGAAIQQLIAKNGDVAAVTPAAALAADAEGHKLRWFYTYMKVFLFGVVVPSDSSVRSIADLKGKAVGISEPGGGEVPIMRGMLRDAGLTEGKDIELLAVGEGGALTVTNFQSGKIAAYTSSFVDILGVQASGFGLRDITPERIRAFPSNGLVMLSERFAKDRDLAGRFARAVAKATLFAQTNPDAAAAIMPKYAPEQFTDPAVGRRLLDEILRRTALPQGTDRYGVNASKEGWDGLVKFLSAGTVTEGALAGPVDVPAMLADETLATANDFDHGKVVAQAKDYKTR